jgi:D-amino-acid oxidase
LAEHGLDVLIRTADRPAATTSAAAGAIWDFVYANHPDVAEWSVRTYAEWEKLAHEDAGVQFVRGTEAARIPRSIPGWAHQLPGFVPCGPGELPSGFAAGWRCSLPVVDMPVYLDYLESRFVAAGGSVQVGAPLQGFEEAFEDASTVVNCAGSGAQLLVKDDPEIEPVRGELVVVANPGVTEFFAEYTDSLVDMTYLLPQGDKLVLGGSAQHGESDRVHDPEVAARIIRRCAEIVPAVADAPVLEYRVGIRPDRPKVRLELDRHDGQTLVHNYGHGGSGVTLSWGCAEAVLGLLQRGC